MAKLHIGCGGMVYGIKPGHIGPNETDWINMDYAFGPNWLAEPAAHELVDGYPRCLAHDMRDPLPFPDAFADGIFTCHALEHIPTRAVLPTLREWRRVLKPGAPARIIVPDLLGIAKKIVETDGFLDWSLRGERTGDWEEGYTKLLTGIFGDQSGPGMLHMTGFTPRHLRDLLHRAGFEEVAIQDVWDHEIFSIEATAVHR